MPTSVEEVKTIKIGKATVEMRPLKIGRLKKFMAEFDNLQSAGANNEDSLDAMINCCVVAMEQYDKDLATKELLEDELDIHDVYKIIEAASGIKLAGDDSGNPEAAELVGQS